MLTPTIQTIIYIIIAMLIGSYLCYLYTKAGKKAKEKEERCKETISANAEIIKTKHFFLKKYYIANVSYEFDNQKYTVRKGIFKDIDFSKPLNIHINPENPEECVIFYLKERV